MKYFLGFFLITVVLFISTYFLLSIWGINMISEENFLKMGKSILVLAATALILIIAIIIPILMKPANTGYDKNQEGIAQKKI